MKPRARALLAGGALLGIFAFVLLRWILVPYRIRGASMEPTLRGSLDIVLVSRHAYSGSAPRRFDVVAIRRSPDHESVKRVVGLPGETVEIRDGKLWINGSAAELPAVLAREPLVSKGAFGRGKVELASGEVFVLGDAGYLSEDSRAWGPVPLTDLEGQIVWRVSPLSRWGKVE